MESTVDSYEKNTINYSIGSKCFLNSLSLFHSVFYLLQTNTRHFANQLQRFTYHIYIYIYKREPKYLMTPSSNDINNEQPQFSITPTAFFGNLKTFYVPN